MTDPTSSIHAGELPPATVYDPAEGSVSAPDLAPTDTVVLLLAAADDPAWAADAAIALGTAWAASGRRIVLADLHLESPSLHERLGAENLEGVVDVFLYGASIARSARPVRDRGFYFISAGTYEPDAEAIYHHPRWPKLVAGFRDAGASLVLFAPAGSADVEALARWSDRAVLLGRPPRRGVAAMLAEGGAPAELLLVPPETAPPAPEAPDEALPAGEAASHPEEAEPRRPEPDRPVLLPPPPVEHAEPRSRTGTWLVALAVLIIVVLLVWLGFLAAGDRAGGAVGASGDGAAESMAAGTPPPAPSRAGDPLPFSVQVKAFNSLPAARQEVTAQAARAPGVPFFVSPEEVQGVLYYKIMAGLATDTVAAGALQQRLVRAGAIDAEDAVPGWSLIRPTPLAFDLGEFPEAAEASVRADSLLAREIPSYPVEMPYSDGTSRWQLYGGAYPDSAGADALRQRLLAAGVEPRLVLRRGRPGTGEDAAVP